MSLAIKFENGKIITEQTTKMRKAKDLYRFKQIQESYGIYTAMNYAESFSRNVSNLFDFDIAGRFRRSARKNDDPIAKKENSSILRLYKQMYDPSRTHKPTATSLGQWLGVEIECCIPLDSLNVSHRECDYICEDHEVFCCHSCEHECNGSNGNLEECYAELTDYLKEKKIKYCTIKSDGSIVAEDGHFPVELTILFKRSDRTNLKKLCEALNDLGAKVNKTCGMHVHLDQRDVFDPMTNKARLSIVKRRANNIGACLGLLAQLVPMSRRNNQYCQLSVSKLNGNRYAAVNTTSFGKYNTIEVRLHSSTTDFNKINNWIDILLLIAARDRSIERVTTLSDFCERFDVPEHLIEYIEHRQKKFSTPIKINQHAARNAEESDDRVSPSTGAIVSSITNETNNITLSGGASVGNIWRGQVYNSASASLNPQTLQSVYNSVTSEPINFYRQGLSEILQVDARPHGLSSSEVARQEDLSVVTMLNNIPILFRQEGSTYFEGIIQYIVLSINYANETAVVRRTGVVMRLRTVPWTSLDGSTFEVTVCPREYFLGEARIGRSVAVGMNLYSIEAFNNENVYLRGA